MPGGTRREDARGGAFEPAQPAMKIADGRAEQPFAELRQRKVAETAQRRRRRVRRARPGEAVADHHLEALSQLLPERLQGVQIVLPVAVSENDEPAARGADAGGDRVAVACARLRDDAGARRPGPLRRPVAAGVVDHHHLAGYRVPGEEPARLPDAPGNGILFVAAEDQYREVERAGRVAKRGSGHVASFPAPGRAARRRVIQTRRGVDVNAACAPPRRGCARRRRRASIPATGRAWPTPCSPARAPGPSRRDTPAAAQAVIDADRDFGGFAADPRRICVRRGYMRWRRRRFIGGASHGATGGANGAVRRGGGFRRSGCGVAAAAALFRR